jgi:hypothetical protein
LDIASWTGLLLIVLLLLERIAKLSDPIRLDVRKRILAPEYESRLGLTSIGAKQILFSLSFWRKQFYLLFELLVENDRHLAGLPGGHQRVRFVRFLKRESVRHEIFRMNFPAHNPLHEIFHKPNACHP